MVKYVKKVNNELEELGDFLYKKVLVNKNGETSEILAKCYGASDKEKRAAGFIPKDEYINNEINANKKLLADSDYKVIKCYEASVLNKELPYDLNAVIELRNGYRETINSLEEDLREYLA